MKKCLLVSPSYSLSTVLHLTFFCSSPYHVSFSSSLCQCTHLSVFCLLHPHRLSAHVLLTISLYICVSLAAARKVIHLSEISPLSIKQPHPKLSQIWILKYCCLLQSFSVQLNCSVKEYLYFGCPSLSSIHPVPSYGLIKDVVFSLALCVCKLANLNGCVFWLTFNLKSLLLQRCLDFSPRSDATNLAEPVQPSNMCSRSHVRTHSSKISSHSI